MQDQGFETLVASIYQSQGKMDEAQEVLETFLAGQHAQGQAVSIPGELQLASIYLVRGDSARAYPLYREALKANPDNTDAWKGLLSTLHSTGHDNEALAQVQQLNPTLRKTLEADPAYLQTVGAIYAGLGHPQEAMTFLNRIQQHYAAQRSAAPADVDIQNAWLLYNSSNDNGLYRALMSLGSRQDLSDEQRRTVQTIWANWSVRRSNQAAQAGNYKRALAILNAAAKAFPDNPAVTKALASGYATAGLPKQAVSIFKAQDLSSGTAADYKASVGAALANNDLKDAEIWLRFGLQQYPRDPQLLVLAAKFEQARGDANRAAAYYRASLAAMPPEDFGAELSGEMMHPAPVTARRPVAKQQDLATLLSAPEKQAPAAEEQQAPAPVYTRPYLPGTANTSIAPVQLNGPDTGSPYASPAGAPVMEPVPTYPGTPDLGGKPAATPKKSKLKDYTPQSMVEGAPGLYGAIHLHPVAAFENVYGPYASYDPSVETPVMARAEANALRAAGGLHTVAFQQSTTSDGTPIVPYADVAKPVHKRTPAEAAKARAAAIRANQDSAPQSLTGVSRPPVEDYNAVQVDGAQFSTGPANAAAQQGAQVQRPQSQQAAEAATARGQVTRIPDQAPSQTGDSYGQQYPQPNTRGTQTAPRTIRRVPPAPQQQQAPVTQQPVGPPITYPVYPQPLANPGVPATGQVYPLPPPPTDQDLIQQNVPPLRGYYDPRPDPLAPLSERQQTELDLAVIEGSYSGWVGGTATGRYRSGTAGIDRLTAVEVPFEASGVANKTVRFSIIPKGVFLNSGVLDTTGGGLGTQPVLGTLPGNAINPPQQQFASGVGGEIQMTTNTLALAAGYTPYGFLVSNVIGRARWKPGNGHFTLYGGRDAVKETMLSYAGLRDPGSSTFNGNIWGGVVETGGGVRFDFGDEKSGFYMQAEGAQLTGYHVLQNRKYDGTMGAYFRVKNWTGIGSLNVGGTMFGEHYDQNERGETYGLGGYFSPNAYFLAAIPVTFSGHRGSYFHYLISGSAGIQTFQEDSQKYFPLDLPIQTGFGSNCGQTVCAMYPVNSNTGLNYSIDAEGSYQASDHWYLGAFLSGNNTNNYNTVSGGFFARYVFRPQYATPDYPTGLFPVEGFRPVRVP
jgi:tetratricopeptide (TPR) repeat protein